ncbi:MAG: hypothetical protein U0T83_11550 [Bacteriovoracaceae bacterium]
MGIEKLISISVMLAILTASTGQIPRVIKVISVAQFKLIKESQSSTWGTPLIPSK